MCLDGPRPARIDDETGDADTGEVVPDFPWVDDLEAGDSAWPAFVLRWWPRDRSGAVALWAPDGTRIPAATEVRPLDTTRGREVPGAFGLCCPVVVGGVEVEASAPPRPIAPVRRMAMACCMERVAWATAFCPFLVDGLVTPFRPSSWPDDVFSE